MTEPQFWIARPCANPTYEDEWVTPPGMPFSGYWARWLSCGTSGRQLSVATAMAGMQPTTPEWLGYCACHPMVAYFNKAPNPPIDPRKKAQDLMHAAENAEHHESPAPETGPEHATMRVGGEPVELRGLTAGQLGLCGPRETTIPKLDPEKVTCCGGKGKAREVVIDLKSITAEGVLNLGSVSVGTIRADALTYSTLLTTEVPALPSGTTVELTDLIVRRGSAKVSVRKGSHRIPGGEDETKWSVGSMSHEAMFMDATSHPPFVREVTGARFDTAKEAVALAVKWLDALDAWYVAQQAADSQFREAVGAA